MKWRPISELGEKQKDGRPYLFICDGDNSEASTLFFNGKDFENIECGVLLTPEDKENPDRDYYWFDYFLDEPLPDKPYKAKRERNIYIIERELNYILEQASHIIHGRADSLHALKTILNSAEEALERVEKLK